MLKLTWAKIKTIIWFSLVHHPLCEQFNHHVIQIRSRKLCLGCTALYSGILFSIILILFGLFRRLKWSTLATISFFCYLPIGFYLMGLSINPKNRLPRFLNKFFLGFGIVIGLLAIIKAPLDTAIVMFIFGVLLYFLIAISRLPSSLDPIECQKCSYERSPSCPGLNPLYHILHPQEQMNLDEETRKMKE